MDIFKNYPKYYRNSLLNISQSGYICIVTFWSKKEIIRDIINKNLLNKIITIGNLYTKEGLKYIIMNSCLCPQIEWLIFTGNDRNNVKESLCYNNFEIIDDNGNDLEKLFWEKFSNRIIMSDEENLNSTIQSLKRFNEKWIEKPIEVAEKICNLNYIESEYSGYIIRDQSLERLWKRVLTKINLFGYLKDSDNGSKQKELLAVVSVLTDKAKVFDEMPNHNILESYIPQVCSENICGDFSYTYGSRLHEFEQIQKCINELKDRKYSRRAISLTWRPQVDSVSLYPPCLILVDFKIQNNMLFMTCYFRSHDAYNAYCMNIYALQQLQINVSKSIGVNLGYLTIISNSCHVYEKDFENISKYNELDCNMDMRGYFIITVENSNIIVKLMNKNNKIIKEFCSTSDEELMVLCQPYISEISHAMYIGKELSRAYQSIKNNTIYYQS